MNHKRVKKILTQLKKIKKSLLQERQKSQKGAVANNLNDYVTLRRFDLAHLQDELTQLGLSSLGRSQSCVISSIHQNINLLEKMLGQKITPDTQEHLNFKRAKRLLKSNAKIFGKNHDRKFHTKIMVTLPSQAATSSKLIESLIDEGVAIMRINTAHDTPKMWQEMASHIQNANAQKGTDTKIYVDLAGPKNRTGEIKEISIPFKIGSKKSNRPAKIIPKSQKDARTQTANQDTPASLVVDDTFFELLKEAKKIKIDDPIRGKKPSGKLHQENQTLYFTPKRKILITPTTKLYTKDKTHSSPLHHFALQAQSIKLFMDEEFILTHQNILGTSPYQYETQEYKAIIACTNHEIFPFLKEGDAIAIDDGKIGCIVKKVPDIGVAVKVTLAKSSGSWLKAQKGINFPSVDLDIPAITPLDHQYLPTVMGFADMIGISFAQSAQDIQILQNILDENDKSHIAIVPKIETQLGINNLPQILHQLILRPNYALMIARGDLAIEIGFDNLPYFQEEIFDICEAAFVPVIYATQILENKMKTNLPSRAEVIDAALAQRADCIMLNKGPYIIETLKILKKILHKMHKRFEKNRQILSVNGEWKSKK